MDVPVTPVLIVDDEPSVLSAIRRELKDTAPVFTAQDPEQARKILEENTIGVVISDYKMPGKDGVTFLSELSSLPYEPVKILLTAYSELDIVVDAVNRAGIYYFLRKPWNSAELRVLVLRALEAFKTKNELKFYKQRLIDIDNIKTSITSLLTHELKTPLTTISGYTELLSRQISNNEVKSVVSSLQNSVQKLETFIDDTLQVARLETGQFEKHIEKIDLKKTLLNIFPYLTIKESVSVEIDPKLLTESLFRIARYVTQQGGKATADYSRSGAYFTIKINIRDRVTKTLNNGQLALFQRLEANGDILHHNSESSMDMIYASAALNAIGATLNVTSTNSELRIEIMLKL